MYERILLPLDGPELAEGALPYAEGIAKRMRSEVVLITVCTSCDGLERPSDYTWTRRQRSSHLQG